VLLGYIAKHLIVPNELERLAVKLLTSEFDVLNAGNTYAYFGEINPHRGKYELIVVDYYTDANDWFLVADWQNYPGVDTIGMLFWNGKEEPEFYTQELPTVGSMFTADKVTYKVRHVYSGDVLDHRAFYRGQG
jgi:hypothetical protein